MPENPSGERTGMVVILTPPNSARRYQYIIRDSLFYDRNNDVEMVYGVIGQFNEEVTISNVTVSNSQIASSGAVLFSIFKLNIDGMYFDSNTQNGQIFINIFSCFFVTLPMLQVSFFHHATLWLLLLQKNRYTGRRKARKP